MSELDAVPLKMLISSLFEDKDTMQTLPLHLTVMSKIAGWEPVSQSPERHDEELATLISVRASLCVVPNAPCMYA